MSRGRPPSKTLTQMLPPPPRIPDTLLSAELQALESSLKETAMNTARVFRFYADARKERISSCAPHPPASITQALGRSLERYDQICDIIETQLQHAISILQRDLKVERARVEAEAEAAASAAAAAQATMTQHPLPDTSSQQIPSTDSPIPGLLSSQPPSGASAISMMPRRSSTILSSLHRPNFPLKLDLSAVALAGGGHADPNASPIDVNLDLGLTTSLPSPVTLAPKTARALPNDPSMPDIFGVGASSSLDGQNDIAGGVGMKTTRSVGDDVDLSAAESSHSADVSQLGNSADKPIELDLEASYNGINLFGGVQENASPIVDDSASVIQNNSTPAPDAQLDMGSLFSPEDDQSFPLPDSTTQENIGGDAQTLLANLTSNPENSGTANELSSLIPRENAPAVSDTAAHDQTSGDAFSGLGDLSHLDLSSFGLFDQHVDSGEMPQHEDGQEDMDLMSQLLSLDGSAEGETKDT